MTQSSTPWPPPEAALIRRAREAMGLSHAEAVKRLAIKMGARRWRQIEDGYESKGGRIAKGGDMQYAHMAHVVGVTPDDLRAAGRDEAAEVLRMLIASAQSEARSNRLTVIEGGGESPAPDEFGLGDEPPFPGVTHNARGLDTPAVANRVWQLAKDMELAYYRERDTESDPRKLRAIQQYELAAKALIDELDSAG